MTLTKEQRAAIEERVEAIKKHAIEAEYTHDRKDQLDTAEVLGCDGWDQEFIDLFSHASIDIPALLQALHEAEAERDRALDQVAVLLEKTITVQRDASTKPENKSDAVSLLRHIADELKPYIDHKPFITTAQAHAARLRQEGREEERTRIKQWVNLNAYKPRDPGLGEFQTVVSFYALREQLQQPTDAAEGGGDA